MAKLLDKAAVLPEAPSGDLERDDHGGEGWPLGANGAEGYDSWPGRDEYLQRLPRPPAPRPKDRLLEVFQGKVERIEGASAHVTLVDSHGQETLATCPAPELQAQNIGEGMGFTLRVTQRNGSTVVTFAPVPFRELSAAGGVMHSVFAH